MSRFTNEINWAFGTIGLIVSIVSMYLAYLSIRGGSVTFFDIIVLLVIIFISFFFILTLYVYSGYRNLLRDKNIHLQKIEKKIQENSNEIINLKKELEFNKKLFELENRVITIGAKVK